MSYDVNIGDTSINYTSNMNPFFEKMIPWYGGDRGLRSLAGKSGEEALGLLGEAFNRISKERHRLGDKGLANQYDASNGWGSVLSATVLLGRLMAACAKHPQGTIEVF